MNQFEGLAPYAASSSDSRGREYDEPEHAYRSLYQRDRDRIVHSTAFRRLEYKTQVFVNYEGDHYRTRLTHTLEVAQISRTIARRLHLNEDLTEALALGHDLGHTPYGHAGEEVLNEMMAGHGGFEHNAHGLRVVDCLESRYPNFPGLNLSHEVRESFVRRAIDAEAAPTGFTLLHASPLLEMEVVQIADEIAYDNHDLDDGLYSGVIEESALEDIELIQMARERIMAVPDDPAMRRYCLIRALIDLLVSDAIDQTLRNLEAEKIDSLDAVRASRPRVLSLSPTIAAAKAQVEAFLHQNFYDHHRVLRMTRKSQGFLRRMFNAYLEMPSLLPPELLVRTESEGVERVVCDHIAGMTDRCAEQEYRHLFEPFARP